MEKWLQRGILLSLFVNIMPASGLDWRQIESPTDKKIFLVTGSSIHDFWIKESTGILYHYFENTWSFITPPDHSFQRFNYAFDPRGVLWCIVVDIHFRSNIFKFINDTWVRENIETEVPLKDFIFKRNGEIWVYGDWGTIYRFDGIHWIPVQSPIAQHILYAFEDNHESIWFATRYSGIFNYDGIGFTNVPIQDYNHEDLIYIEKNAGRLLSLSSDGHLFYYIDEKFEKIKDFPPDIYGNPQQKMAGREILIGKKGIILANEEGDLVPIEIENSWTILSGIIFDDGTGVLTGAHGALYLRDDNPPHMFHDKSGEFYVEGGKNDWSIAGGMININNDRFPDMMVINRGKNKPNRLLINEESKLYQDISFQSEFDHFTNSNNLIVGSMDRSPGNEFYTFKIHENYLELNTLYKIFGFWRKKVETIRIRPSEKLTQVCIADFNRDGDLDFALSFYYGKLKQRGHILILDNGLNNFKDKENSFPDSASVNWNSIMIPGDFNGDDWIDIFVGTYWGPDYMLENRAGKFTRKKIIAGEGTASTNTYYGTAADYDNDGDLDLFIINLENNLQVLRNDGKGVFDDFTDSLGIESAYEYKATKQNFFLGDFNNDSYLDLFISNYDYLYRQNWLFYSQGGQKFADFAKDQNLDKPVIDGGIVGDIDSDGDLDIYGLRFGLNSLWINNLNNQQYLTLDLIGAGENQPEIGTKIWVYSSGHLNDNRFLVAFQQTGTGNSQPGQYHSGTVHFGLGNHDSVDVRIKFSTGNTVERTNLKAGTHLTVYSNQGISKVLAKFRDRIIFAATHSSIISMFLISFLTLVFIGIGIYRGIKKYHWSIQLSLVILLLNVSAYWILLILTRPYFSITLQLLNVIPVIIGISIPLFWSQQSSKYDRNPWEELLSQVLIFSHGEWAMRNINSVILLAENISGKSSNNPEPVENLTRRIRTFEGTVMPALTGLIQTGKLLKEVSVLFTGFAHRVNELKKILNNISTEQSSSYSDFSLFGIKLISLKTDLDKIKTLVYARFSTDIHLFAGRLENSYTDLFEKKQIGFSLKISSANGTCILIPEQDLIPILDNALHNSIKSISAASEFRTVSIFIYDHLPKIHIEIRDSGCGITESEWANIFNQGYSLTQGTGLGLYHSKTILNKYGGRMFVNKSTPGQGTSMLIELQEGRKRHGLPSADN